AVDAGFGERAIEHGAGRADERLALQVLLVARLLAHEHDARMRRPLAEHGLRRILVERTAAAVRRVLPRRRQAGIGRRLDLRRRGKQVGLGLGVLSRHGERLFGWGLLFSLCSHSAGSSTPRMKETATPAGVPIPTPLPMHLGQPWTTDTSAKAA